MVPGRAVIENPLSGEQIVILETGIDSGGELLGWELTLAPGGHVPSSHAHPTQEERFTVVEGRMRFRVGVRRLVVGPGETVRVPPGTRHHFANAGPLPAVVSVETRPALAMEEMLEVAAALARDQHDAGRRLPRPFELALFMHQFEREVRAPYLPAPLVRAAMAALARFACWRGLDARYRQLTELDRVLA